ncbi:family 10 glycosylhydrolase [Candidatus Sumerlaeota bacterium]|nr:family 10 glycosylhydrolase [Candidatus Sumerlaeota bacterium]
MTHRRWTLGALSALALLSWATAPVAAQSHRLDAIDPPREGEFPGSRGTGQMILYTPAYGHPTTGTNEWGVEAIIEDGLVTQVGPNSSPIPENGFVVSGHEGAARWIGLNLHPGTAVTFDEREVRIDDSPRGQLRSLRARVMEAEATLIEHRASRGALRMTMMTRNAIDDLMQAESIGAVQLAEVTRAVNDLESQAWDLELAAIPSPEGEPRGVWHRLEEFTPEAIAELVEDLAETHVNVLLPETIYNSAAIYRDPTGLYPLKEDLDGFDALACLIDECHARGIEVHVWVECFFIGGQSEGGPLPHLAEAHPDWLACDRMGRQVSVAEEGFMYFNPSHPEVRQALIDAYVALCEDYAIDGFQFDYIRYCGGAWDIGWDHSDFTRGLVQEELGFDPLDITPDSDPEAWEQWLAWREEQITSFVREASAAMRAVRPDIRLSAAIVPDLDLAREMKGQNWAAWMEEGLIDILMPMSYTFEASAVAATTSRAAALAPEGLPLVSGLGAYMGLTPRQVLEQIQASRDAGAAGQCLFAWHSVPEPMRYALSRGPWRSGGPVVWTEASQTETPLEAQFHDAAMDVAEWMLRNQIQDWPDANNGRFLATHNPETQVASYSDNWMTGASMMGMLMAYHRTEDERFLEAAELGASYLMSMQILDPRDPVAFGAFREITPQYTWCYPRDALTGAWGLLWLFDETGDERLLDRVDLFIDWFKREAMADGWPLWEMNFRGEPHQCASLMGSFHGGDGAFFWDYYRVTGDDSHLEDGLRFIADGLIETFLREDGSYRIVWDREEGGIHDGVDDPRFPLSWQIMHRYNDDFSTVSLLAAHLHFGDEIYLERTEAFARWLISEQRPDGSFGSPPVSSASATGPIMLLDLHRLTGDEEYREAAVRAGRHLMTLQETESDDPRARGGFYGMAPPGTDEQHTINLRTSAYALIALLKLEGEELGPYYSIGDRDGNWTR